MTSSIPFALYKYVIILRYRMQYLVLIFYSSRCAVMHNGNVELMPQDNNNVVSPTTRITIDGIVPYLVLIGSLL